MHVKRKAVCILAHSLRLEFIMIRKVWQREAETAGHITSRVRVKRAIHTDAHLSFFSFLFWQGPQPME